MTQTALKDRIRIFDRSGAEVAGFQAEVARSWAIGTEGRASFEYSSIKTNIVNERVLKFGNILLIENSRLPAWVGVIDTPRQWDARTITVNAYTMERYFKWRVGPPEQKLSGSAGSIFAQMVNYINNQELTVLRNGNIWTGGTYREETLNPVTLDRNLEQLQQRSLEEYEFAPSAGGRLLVYANWAYRLGTYTPLTLLEAENGGNIEKPTMREDGDITNWIIGYGDGMSWTSRPYRYATDGASWGKYGLRQTGQEYNGVSQTATIDNNNTEYLTKNKEPRKIFEVTALNVGNTFDFLRLGNRVAVKFIKLGFTNGVLGTSVNTRILGMSYNPRNGQKVKLVLEDV